FRRVLFRSIRDRGEVGRYQLNAMLPHRTSQRPGWGLKNMSNKFSCPLVMDKLYFWTMASDQLQTSVAIEPYLSHLRALPFVKKLRVLAPHTTATYYDATLEVVTPAGKRKVSIEWRKSHLNRDIVAHLTARLSRVKEYVLLLAPLVGPTVGERLARAGVGYLDLAGNCDI